ncbi:MAG: helix-turn-helix transcriptional regulator [Erysipelotrichaceae bacterium]|nr:helix-turn-helix transcriptional regulator [Erysipelotrichaceae bacterium]
MKSHLLLKNKVHEYRIKKGMSQAELAKIVGSSRNTISSIETGQFAPSAYLAALLCIALDCKFEDLFYLEADE